MLLSVFQASPLLEAFSAALNDTTFPGQRWDGWVAALLRLLQNGDRVRLLFQ